MSGQGGVISVSIYCVYPSIYCLPRHLQGNTGRHQPRNNAPVVILNPDETYFSVIIILSSRNLYYIPGSRPFPTPSIPPRLMLLFSNPLRELFEFHLSTTTSRPSLTVKR